MTDASLAGLLLRLIVSMGVVIGLMLLAARMLRRNGGLSLGGRNGRRAPINVEAVQALTRGANIAVVRAAGREFVLGVTDQQVTLLHSSIETRSAVDELDGDTPAELPVNTSMATATTATTARPSSATPDATDARIADVAAENGSDTELDGHLSAWTDALELLREKTVRR